VTGSVVTRRKRMSYTGPLTRVTEALLHGADALFVARMKCVSLGL